MIIFMLKQLRLAGCEFPASAMQCHPCDETRVGGFSPEHGILMCQNRFMNKKHMEDTLAHEMIHAFDHCRFKVDWSNLRHHACSEVSLFLHCPWGILVYRCVIATNLWCCYTTIQLFLHTYSYTPYSFLLYSLRLLYLSFRSPPLSSSPTTVADPRSAPPISQETAGGAVRSSADAGPSRSSTRRA